MNWLLPALFANLVIALIVALVYLYLYLQDGQRFLGIWSASWGLYTLRFVFSVLGESQGGALAFQLADLLTTLASGMLLLWGTQAFLGRRMPPWWAPVSLACAIWMVLSPVLDWPFLLQALPTFTLLGGIYIWTGWQLLRSPALAGPGKFITAWAFILWGMHKIDYPLLRPLAGFAPWGYLLAAFLGQAVALGVLLVYFQLSRQELRAREQRSRAFSEMSSDYLYVFHLDERGTPVLDWMSDSFTRLTGWNLTDLTASWESLVLSQNGEKGQTQEQLARLQAGETLVSDVCIPTKDGGQAWVHNITRPAPDSQNGASPTFFGAAQDITARVQAEEALRRKTYQQERLIASARHLNESLDLQQVLERIAWGAKEILEAYGCAIYLLEPDGKRLSPVVSIEPPYDELVLAAPLEVDSSFTGQAVLARRGLIFNDAGHNPAGYLIPGTDPEPEERVIVAPFFAGDRVLGAMCLDRIGRCFSEEDLALGETFAAYAGAALKNAQDHDRLQREVAERRQREREMEAIVSVATALRSAQTRAEMAPLIVSQMRDLLQADRAALILRDAGSGENVVELSSGDTPLVTGMRLLPGLGATGHIIATGQPYVTNDGARDPYIAVFNPLLAPPSLAGVPLIVQNETIGALLVGRDTSIGEAEMRVLTAIGEIAASAIRRSGLFEETQRRLRRLNALHAIDKAITSNQELESTLAVALEQVTGQLSVAAAVILRYERVTQTLLFAAGRGLRSTSVQRATLRLGRSYAGIAALERRSLHIPDIASDPVAPQGIRSLAEVEGFRAYVAVPLVAHGELQGVLELFHTTPFDADEEWWNFLDTLARQIAIAIDNAGLFKDLQDSNLELTLAYDTTLEGWARAMELRDKETQGHCRRVTEMTLRLARAVGMSAEQLVHVRRGALLHDIGKMGIPDSILLKPGPLTEAEWDEMRRHPQYALDMLASIDYLIPALDIPYSHHERWDGTGYPRGLQGEAIPLAARLFAVVDVWDALLNDRPYRPAWPEERVRAYLQEQAGKQFDPQVVRAFLELLDQDEQNGVKYDTQDRWLAAS